MSGNNRHYKTTEAYVGRLLSAGDYPAVERLFSLAEDKIQDCFINGSDKEIGAMHGHVVELFGSTKKTEILSISEARKSLFARIVSVMDVVKDGDPGELGHQVSAMMLAGDIVDGEPTMAKLADNPFVPDAIKAREAGKEEGSPFCNIRGGGFAMHL